MTYETFFKIRYDHGTQKVVISEYIGNMSVYHEALTAHTVRIQSSALEYCLTLEEAERIALELFYTNYIEEIQRDIDFFKYCIKAHKKHRNIFNFRKTNKEIEGLEKSILKFEEKKERKHQNNIIINRIPYCLDLKNLIKDDQLVYIVNNYINKASQNAYEEKIKTSVIFKEGNKYNISYILSDLNKDKYTGRFDFEDIHENEIRIPGYSAKAFFSKEKANSYCQEKIYELELAKMVLVKFMEKE